MRGQAAFMDTPAPHRLAVALLALAAWGTLILQAGIDLGEGDTLLASLWADARFFTNLSVLLLALCATLFAVRGWGGPSLPAALVVWMSLTGGVYHALLAVNHHPEGWDILVNVFQHTVLPLGMLLIWLGFAPKAGLRWRDPVLWTGWPLIYAVYGLARGLADGTFPYFFLNPDKTGWLGVGAYILGLGAVFYLAGLLVLGLARLSNRARMGRPEEEAAG